MKRIARIIFGKGGASGDPGTGSSRPGDIKIAACAILLEMSFIDGEFDSAERNLIISILRNEYGVGRDDFRELLSAAREELDNSVDLWRFTRLANTELSRQEKERLVEMVWMIALADGKLEAHEDYLMHKLANLLHLSHRQLIEAKERAKAGK